MPIISILNQPASNGLAAAYRPIMLTVRVNNVTAPRYYDIVVGLDGKAVFYAKDTTPFAAGGLTSITFAGATAINGTYTISSIVISAGNIVTIQVGGGLTPGVYYGINISLNGTLIADVIAPPVVYCDVYVNDVFYKSVQKTQCTILNTDNSDWQFDIQDPCQEVLKKVLASNGQTTIYAASGVSAVVYCKFRSSGFDSNGFISPEDTAPVQGTGMIAPVAGTGTVSNSFFVINSVLQHENNQQLDLHLNSYKKRTWTSDTFPLSHRMENYKVSIDKSDTFPILYIGANTLSCLRIWYKLKGQSTFQKRTNCLGDNANLIFAWDKDAAESVDLTGTLNGTFTEVDWGDGTVDTLLTHTYAASGNYTVKFYDSTTTIFNIGNKFGPFRKVTAVTAWPFTLVEINLINSYVATVPSLSPLVNLQSFKLLSPNLAAIPDFTNNPQLNLLQIVSSVASGGGVVDLSNNPLLTYIELYGNHITNVLGVAAMTNIGHFHIQNNEIATADINNILVALDASGAINGYGAMNIQTPAAPPIGAGVTAYTSLTTTKGWVINTD